MKYNINNFLNVKLVAIFKTYMFLEFYNGPYCNILSGVIAFF